MHPLANVNHQIDFYNAFLTRLEDVQTIQTCAILSRSVRQIIFKHQQATQLNLSKIAIETIAAHLKESYPQLSEKCQSLIILDYSSITTLKQLKETLKTQAQGLAWFLKDIPLENLKALKFDITRLPEPTHFHVIEQLFKIYDKWKESISIANPNEKSIYILKLIDQLRALKCTKYALEMALSIPLQKKLSLAISRIFNTLDIQEYLPELEDLLKKPPFTKYSSLIQYKVVKALRFTDIEQALQLTACIKEMKYQNLAFNSIVTWLFEKTRSLKSREQQLLNLKPAIQVARQLNYHHSSRAFETLSLTLMKLGDLQRACEFAEKIPSEIQRACTYAHFAIEVLNQTEEVEYSLKLLESISSTQEEIRSEVQAQIVHFLCQKHCFKQALDIINSIKTSSFQDEALKCFCIWYYDQDPKLVFHLAQRIRNLSMRHETLCFLIDALSTATPKLALHYFLFLPVEYQTDDLKQAVLENQDKMFRQDLEKLRQVEDPLHSTLIKETSTPVLRYLALEYCHLNKIELALHMAKQLPASLQPITLWDMSEILLQDDLPYEALRVALKNTNPEQAYSLSEIALEYATQEQYSRALEVIDLIKLEEADVCLRSYTLTELILYFGYRGRRNWELAQKITDPYELTRALNHLIPKLLKDVGKQTVQEWADGLEEGAFKSQVEQMLTEY